MTNRQCMVILLTFYKRTYSSQWHAEWLLLYWFGKKKILEKLFLFYLFITRIPLPHHWTVKLLNDLFHIQMGYVCSGLFLWFYSLQQSFVGCHYRMVKLANDVSYFQIGNVCQGLFVCFYSLPEFGCCLLQNQETAKWPMSFSDGECMEWAFCMTSIFVTEVCCLSLQNSETLKWSFSFWNGEWQYVSQ
jgi:hypothetical protein